MLEGVLLMWPKARRLAQARAKMGYSQQTLADVSRVPKRSIENYEGGQRSINNAPAAQVVRLARALDVSVESLMEDEE